MKAMEGKSTDELMDKLRRDYWATMKMNWSVWPVISFINFRFIPPAQRCATRSITASSSSSLPLL